MTHLALDGPYGGTYLETVVGYTDSGQRRIDGESFDGTVFYLGTNEISRR